MLLIPCPPAGARERLDAIDDTTASPAEMVRAVREVCELLHMRELLLAYIGVMGGWPNKN